MNMRRIVVVLAFLLGAACAGPAYGEVACSGDGPDDRLGQVLEQNDHLRRLLEEMRGELAHLRQEVDQLRSSVGALKPSTDNGAGNPEHVRPADDAELANRLMRVEDEVGIHASQIREQDQTKVESDSRFKVRLFGTVLYNAWFNTQDTAEQAVPVAAVPSSVRVANGGDNFGATLRQTSFGFGLTGPKLGAARLSADVDFDFYGGAPGVYGTDVLGALRMRTAAARLDGKHTSLALGLMSPMISPLNPISLAAVYYPALGDSGNLWQWLPQVTVEHRAPVSESGSLVLQGGLLMPSGENFYGRGLQGKPGYESRVAFARALDFDRRVEIGLGGYMHPRNFGFGRQVNSYALTADWLIPLHKRLEIAGEAYYGQSITLRAASGSEISQFFAFTGGLDDPASSFRGVRSAGGWIQLHVAATPRLEFNAAYGTDDPRNRDIFSGLVRNSVWLRNRTLSLNSIYRLRSNFLLALEYRRLSTLYPHASSRNDHFNLAVGYLF